MPSEISKPRSWRRQNGETIAVGVFVELNANNARLRLEDDKVVDVPLVDLCPEDLAFILAPPKDAAFLGVGPLSSSQQSEDEPPLTINAQVLLPFAKSPDPILWPADQFCNSVKNPKSGLDGLLDAHVTHAASYHEPGAAGHDYIIVRIHTDILGEGDRFWLRCQRNPGAQDRRANAPALYKLLSSNRKIPAADSVKFSLDEFKLRNTKDILIVTSEFENVQVKHLISLLEIIHSASSSYDLLSYNSWWFSDIIIKTLDRLGENWDNRVKRSMWKTVTTSSGSGTTKSTHEVTKRFLEQWKPAIDISGANTPIKSPEPSTLSPNPSGGSISRRYSQRVDPDAKIPEFSTSTTDPFISTIRTLGVLVCPVPTFCGLIRSNPAIREGRVHSLVRRRRTTRVKDEFIVLHVRVPDMTDIWIRLERTASIRLGLLSVSNSPINDTCRVSETESRLLSDDASHIAAVVEFGTFPTLDNLQRLLTVISEESKGDVLKENCWFYASTIQDVLTEWCNGQVQGTISPLKAGKDARDRILARKNEIMGPPDAA